MVKIYSETIDDEIMETARMLCRVQKEDVVIITSTGTVEVHHETESEKT